VRDSFLRWLRGEAEPMDFLPDPAETPNLSRRELKELSRRTRKEIIQGPGAKKVVLAERRVFRAWYRLAALVCCGALMLVFLYMVGHISRFGMENPRATEVSDRYITQGLQETGAVNIVAGMILDYRAFDTLGESHVLFTALICVMILLRRDSKNMRSDREDYCDILQEKYYPTDQDPILRRVGLILSPCILLFGVYVLLGGHLGPGGGFSGGAILGTGLVILASSLGDSVVDRVLTDRRFRIAAFLALSFYSFAKGYVFFTGANGLENHIPKGIPGAILSAGLILPLDIAVGLVVACTMFGFYSLFRRGSIGGD